MKCAQCGDKLPPWDLTVCRKCSGSYCFKCYGDHLKGCKILSKDRKDPEVPGVRTGLEHGHLVPEALKILKRQGRD